MSPEPWWLTYPGAPRPEPTTPENSPPSVTSSRAQVMDQTPETEDVIETPDVEMNDGDSSPDSLTPDPSGFASHRTYQQRLNQTPADDSERLPTIYESDSEVPDFPRTWRTPADGPAPPHRLGSPFGRLNTQNATAEAGGDPDPGGSDHDSGSSEDGGHDSGYAEDSDDIYAGGNDDDNDAGGSDDDIYAGGNDDDFYTGEGDFDTYAGGISDDDYAGGESDADGRGSEHESNSDSDIEAPTESDSEIEATTESEEDESTTESEDDVEASTDARARAQETLMEVLPEEQEAQRVQEQLRMERMEERLGIEAEKAAREEAEREEAEREQAAREEAEREKAEREKAEKEKAEKEKAAREEAERIEREQAAREQAEREKAAQEQAAKEQDEREMREEVEAIGAEAAWVGDWRLWQKEGEKAIRKLQKIFGRQQRSFTREKLQQQHNEKRQQEKAKYKEAKRRSEEPIKQRYEGTWEELVQKSERNPKRKAAGQLEEDPAGRKRYREDCELIVRGVRNLELRVHGETMEYVAERKAVPLQWKEEEAKKRRKHVNSYYGNMLLQSLPLEDELAQEASFDFLCTTESDMEVSVEQTIKVETAKQRRISDVVYTSQSRRKLRPVGVFRIYEGVADKAVQDAAGELWKDETHDEGAVEWLQGVCDFAEKHSCFTRTRSALGEEYADLLFEHYQELEKLERRAKAQTRVFSDYRKKIEPIYGVQVRERVCF
ncbi:hypothetical protein CJU89_3744 [Yarrowia sp. B02]|nr:hypothetical protein CJU89_3744 [Yarrowia sp. B02]